MGRRTRTRRGTGGAWAALLLLVALPLAAAGTAEAPQITDARGDAPSSALDITAVWLENTPQGVRFTIQVASMPAPRPLHLFSFGFTLGLTDETVGLGFDKDGALRSSVDTPSGWGAPGVAARLDDALLDEEFRRGRPATLSATLPPEHLGIERGSRLRELGASAVYYEDGWNLGVDEATSRATFVADGPEARVLPVVVPAWAIPTIVLACTAIGAGAGYALVRARRQSPSSPLSPASPASPPPPGSTHPYRMRKHPK